MWFKSDPFSLAAAVEVDVSKFRCGCYDLAGFQGIVRL